jgi:hypothetical protein
MTTITIKGQKDLDKKIKDVESLQPVKDAMKAAAVHVKGKIAEYPPATEANVPKDYGAWYERGFGTRYRRRDGTLHNRKTSETLGRKWTIAQRDGGLTQIVGNNVSYGPFVQGEEQAWFHMFHHWKTTDQVAEEESQEVTEFIMQYIERAFER